MLIIEVVIAIMHEEIRGMGEIVVIIEGTVTEIKIMIGTGVGHIKHRIEVGEMIEV